MSDTPRPGFSQADISEKRLMEAIDKALNPKGMSTHDGIARVHACDIARVLTITASLRAELAAIKPLTIKYLNAAATEKEKDELRRLVEAECFM